MNDFFKRIENLLNQQKKTQKELSKCIDLASPQIYTNWKSRNSIPSADIAVKIAKYLNTTVEFLVTGTESDEFKNKYESLKNSVQNAINEN